MDKVDRSATKPAPNYGEAITKAGMRIYQEAEYVQQLDTEYDGGRAAGLNRALDILEQTYKEAKDGE